MDEVTRNMIEVKLRVFASKLTESSTRVKKEKMPSISLKVLFGFPAILLAICVLFQSQEGFLLNEKDERIVTIVKDCSFVGNPTLSQDSPELIMYIQKYHLTPPPKKKPRLIMRPRKDSNNMLKRDSRKEPKRAPKRAPKKAPKKEFMKESKKEPKKDSKKNTSIYRKDIMKLFRMKRGGFFVEASAKDGGISSNTFQLERNYNWTGLLIEPNPYLNIKLRLQKRQAWLAGVCLAHRGYPEKIRFMHHVVRKVKPRKLMAFQTKSVNSTIQYNSSLVQNSSKLPVLISNEYVYAGQVECIPLYSILLAVKRRVVDYFSLDMDGMELKVLKSIPFNRVKIKVFSIEYTQIPEGEGALISFLASKRYIVVFKKYSALFAVHRDFIREFGMRLKFE